MFWNKSQGDPSEGAEIVVRGAHSSVPPASTGGDLAVEALETLADVLRSMGRHSFDLDDLTSEDASQAFEKWASKLLLGDTSSGEVAPGEQRRGIRRDWGGVKRFVERHRQSERAYVVTGMSNLRQAVRVFIQCTTGSFRAERASEARVSEQLDHLGRALAVNDHAQIRAAAEQTALTVRVEMEERATRQAKQIAALQHSMEQLRHELSQARREAKTDALTQVFNRAALDAHISEVADHALLSHADACVLMVDIDHFKGINDTYGHQSGDEVLRKVADAIVREFRRQEDFVARYGGEEFCIVAEQTTFETTRERAELLRQAVEKMVVPAFGKAIHVSVSFGLAALKRGETAQSWLQRADEALYRAKKKGRNRISIAPVEGEGLGGAGAPLGASLGVRGTEPSRIVHARAEPERVEARVVRSTDPVAAPRRTKKKERTRAKESKETPASPIAALLSPPSRR